MTFQSQQAMRPPPVESRPVFMLRMEVDAPASTEWHAHPRFQLLYAARGLVTVNVEQTSWVIPESHALLIPADVRHRASCGAPVCLCTAYIEASTLDSEPMRMLKVSPLLDASLQALAAEPFHYDCSGRGGCLAKLIVDEIKRAKEATVALPMPTDERLQTVCRALLATPSLDLDLDDWAAKIGLSRRTFTRKFRSETHLSFSEWRLRLRVMRASAAEGSGMSASRAAKSVGYRSEAALRAVMGRLSRRIGRQDAGS